MGSSGTKNKTPFLKSPLQKAQFTPLIAYFLVAVFILVYFIEAYTVNSFSRVPVGWDTAWYISEINTAKAGLIQQVVQGSGFTDFLYPIIFSFLPLNAFSIETYVPIVVTLAIPIAAFVLVRMTSDYKGWIAIFAMSAWFAIYRISSDLHNNLLGIAICLPASGLLLSSSFTRKRAILIFSAFLVSSFVHIETTIFFALVIILTLIITRKIISNYGFRLLLLVTSVLPALFLYINTQNSRLLTEGTIATGNQVIGGDVFENGFGIFLLAFVIAGLLFLLFKKNKNSFDVFLLSWSFSSFLIIGLYFFIPISNFAYRLLVIFPCPFLVVPLIDFVVKKAFSTEINKNVFKYLLVAFILTTVTSASAMTSYSLQYYPKVFIPKDVYDELMYLKNYNMNTSANGLIFVYNLADPGIVELYDHWISAIIGDHLSYYGNLLDLFQLKEGFDNLISTRFYNVLKVMRPDQIFNRTLVIVNQFYSDENVLSYINATELQPDVFLCNLEKLATQPSLDLPITELNYTSIGNWYTNPDYNAFEIYSNETQDPYVSVYLNVPSEIYNISLTYWDGSLGNGLKIYVNNGLSEVINYNATAGFRSSTIKDISSTNSLIVVKIQVFRPNPYQYFARLKSITITPDPLFVNTGS